MTASLLLIIYLSFISLGLPDSLLGSAWPAMFADVGSTSSGAGTIFVLISLCTILSSICSSRLIFRLGTGRVTAFSVTLTALALFGFSCSRSIVQLLFWAVPYGFGAGCVDAGLNHYVALHYRAKHMSWLHCMWGIGASTGPLVMGWCLHSGSGWQAGYRTIAAIQARLSLLLWLSLPLWKRTEEGPGEETRSAPVPLRTALRLPGVKAALVSFFGYSALEQSMGLWAASWLHGTRGMTEAMAASCASFFYLGITLGRAGSGFVSGKFGDRAMIRIGLAVLSGGLLLLPFAPLPALPLIGFGCAPIYPALIHATPARFGRENSQTLVGWEMAAAYTGTTCMPKLFGWIAEVSLLPLWLLGLWVLTGAMNAAAWKLQDRSGEGAAT